MTSRRPRLDRANYSMPDSPNCSKWPLIPMPITHVNLLYYWSAVASADPYQLPCYVCRFCVSRASAALSTASSALRQRRSGNS